MSNGFPTAAVESTGVANVDPRTGSELDIRASRLKVPDCATLVSREEAPFAGMFSPSHRVRLRYKIQLFDLPLLIQWATRHFSLSSTCMPTIQDRQHVPQRRAG